LEASVTEYADVPAGTLRELQTICLGLPDAYEQQAWAGTRWCVRKRSFAHVLTLDSPLGPSTVLSFRSSGAELAALRASGHPFFRPGWGDNVVGMVLDGATDWGEVAELLTESFCIMAPKKLAALVERPPPGPDEAEADLTD
jgi:YjbR